MVIKEKKALLSMTDESYLSERLKARLKEIISARIGVLEE
jgi:hypothetical protein